MKWQQPLFTEWLQNLHRPMTLPLQTSAWSPREPFFPSDPLGSSTRVRAQWPQSEDALSPAPTSSQCESLASPRRPQRAQGYQRMTLFLTSTSYWRTSLDIFSHVILYLIQIWSGMVQKWKRWKRMRLWGWSEKPCHVAPVGNQSCLPGDALVWTTGNIVLLFSIKCASQTCLQSQLERHNYIIQEQNYSWRGA